MCLFAFESQFVVFKCFCLFVEKKSFKKKEKKVEKRIVLIMDNLVLISKKNMAKDDIDCELQNENVEFGKNDF